MVSLQIVGLNCGTSVDGVDVAHCRISSVPDSNDVTIQILSYTEVAVDPGIRGQVLRLCRPDDKSAATSMAEVCDLNFALGREFSRAVQVSGINLSQVDAVASHGQTLWHQPVGNHRSTLQMAEPAVIAQQTGRTVISNFRVAEVAAGRQGAPLSGFFEAGLLSDPDTARIIQNVGGMGNATVLLGSSKRAVQTKDASSTYFAFDTGPGNVFIDAAMRILTNGEEHYDRDGMRGAAGEAEIDEAFVREYLAEEVYFRQLPPKTTGRELFSDDVAHQLVERLRLRGISQDGIIATITRITSASIAQAYEDFAIPLLKEHTNIDEIYLCGGGAFNPNIIRYLQARFPWTYIGKLDNAPIQLDPSAKEAVLFALLGFLCLCGRTVPLATDAETDEPAVLGAITPGKNYRDLIQRVVKDKAFTSNGVLGRVLVVASEKDAV